jgi:ATP adenylyltransferase
MDARWQNHCFRTLYALRQYAETRKLWDTPILETDFFVVLPTVAPLVEGWLLVVPKESALCFAKIPITKFHELEVLLASTLYMVETAYGPAAVFEHGPASPNSRIGCGVDHAHLHVVPTGYDILSTAQVIAPNVHWTACTSIRAVAECEPTRDYWFLHQSSYSNPCHIGQLADGKVPSQLFRQVIASNIGRPSDYDWKQDAREGIIAATVARLGRSVALR